MSIFVVSLFLFSIISTVYGVSLSDDPSMFPGHLEPLGSKRPQQQLITLEDYPEPIGKFRPVFVVYVFHSHPIGLSVRARCHFRRCYLFYLICALSVRHDTFKYAYTLGVCKTVFSNGIASVAA